MANIFNSGAWSQQRTTLRESGTATGTAVQDPAHVGGIQGAFGTVRAAELDRSPAWPRRLRYLMAASSYPNLGFDPCPGDLRGYQALAAYAGRSATTLADAVQTLTSAEPQEWRGQAAGAFRAHVDQDVLPLARKAGDSVGKAAATLHTWAITLAGLQDEARALDRQAAPYRAELDAALRFAGLPAGSTPPYPVAIKLSQTARPDEANTALAGVLAKADDIHTRW
jgi:hypothetical protein